MCPRDTDRMDTPKMEPMGRRGAEVFMLWSQPSRDDDAEGMYLSDKAGREVERAFGRRFIDRQVMVGSVVQCAGDDQPTLAETACCRNRVVAEIEACAPQVIVTIGDEAMRWATGIEGQTALPFRGTMFAAKIGNHVCWVYPILYPNYVHKKGNSYGKSEYEWALEYDARILKEAVETGLGQPDMRSGPYDTGIEIITGQAAGDMQRLEKALEDLVWAPRSALDIETNGLRPFMMKTPLILTAAVGTFDKTVAFALDHPDGWGSAHQRQRVKRTYYEYLAASGRKACHNLAFEMEWTVADGGAHLLRRTEWDDTMASSYVLDGRPGTKALGMQTQVLFGFDLKAQNRVDPKKILEYPIKEVLRYNGMDTKWTNAVRDAHAPQLDATPQFRQMYENLVSLAPALVLTTAKGLPVDYEFADAAVLRLDKEAKEIERKLRQDQDVMAYVRKHGTFSPTAPEHLLQLLQDMGRKEIQVVNKKTKEIKLSTSEEVLVEIGAEVPACALVLEHRGVMKNSGTYVIPTADGTNVCPDGMIRSNYNSMLTVTTRLSADDPAIQNWPKRKHKWVRAMIAVRALEEKLGKRLWFTALDYGQIEFRVVGMASEDPTLVEYCWTGYDVHKAWALRLVEVYPEVKDWVVSELGVDWDEAGIKALRQEMKNKWVFPQLFGSSTRSCAASLHLPDDIADDLGAEFWDEFRKVKKWQDKVIANYERNLYVETLTGARRRGPMTKNEAINMPIQGTAAAIVTKAMDALSVEAELTDDDELQPSLNVHDDLSTILEDSTMEAKIDRTAAIMCKHRFDFINVPLVVEASVGPNWADLKEIKVYRSDAIYNLRNPYA